MPLVPAAGYPTGPEAPPQISPAVPEDFLRVQATPEAFGAEIGHSMSALGGVLAKSSDELAQVALERQELHNNVVSDNQINNFNDATNKVMYGDPDAPAGSPQAKGYYALRGQDAVNAFPGVRDQLVQLRADMRDQLDNQFQQLEFDRQTRRQLSFEMGRAGAHYDQQYDVFQSDTNKAGAALANQKMASSFDDPVQFNAAVADRMNWEYKQLQAQGLAGDKNAVWAMMGRVRSDAAKTQVEGYLARNNPTGARAFLTAHPDMVTDPATLETLNTRIKSGLVQQGAREITAGVVGGGGDLWSSIKTAEAGVKPDGTAAVSPKGAIGISQILPSTAQKVAGELGVPYDEGRLHTDKDYNEMLGKRYLQDMLGRYGNNPVLASAAYNAGPDNVDKWISRFGDPRTGAISNVEFAAKIPIDETRAYVQRTGLAAGASGTGASLEQMEEMGRTQAAAYAQRNNLDPDTTTQLTEQTLSRIRTQYNISAAALRSNEQSNLTLARAQVIAGGPSQSPFHSLDDYLSDPARRQLYDTLKPNDQLALNKQIETASTHVPLTPERLQRFSELHGMSISDPAGFMAIDPLKEDLPVSMKKQLIAMRDQITKGAAAPFDTIKAMNTIEQLGYLQDTGIDKKTNPQLYHQFLGALSDAGQQFKAENKRPPNTEEIRNIATNLLKVAIPGSQWNPFSSDTRQFETIVPNADRDDIVRAYSTQFKRNPTPAQILQIYHYQLEHAGTGPNQAAAEAPLPQ